MEIDYIEAVMAHLGLTRETAQVPLVAQQPGKHLLDSMRCEEGVKRPPPEEDEVALVVQGGYLAAAEAGVLVEQRGKHAAQAVPKARVKVVQHQLWLGARRPPMALGECTNSSARHVPKISAAADFTKLPKTVELS